MDTFMFFGIIIITGLIITGIVHKWYIRVIIVIELMIFSALLTPTVGYIPPKARQSEAKQSLGTIAKNQEAYFFEFGMYADSLEKLRFAVKAEEQKYTYSLSLSKSGYTATAISKTPGINMCGEGDDVWTMNQSLTLENVRNAFQTPCLNPSPSPEPSPTPNPDIKDYIPLLPAIIFIILCLCYDLYRFIRHKIMKKNQIRNDYDL